MCYRSFAEPEIEPLFSNLPNNYDLNVSVGTQVSIESNNKAVQVSLAQKVLITSLWDSDEKLYTMTGVSSWILLNKIVNICEDIKKNDLCLLSMKDKVLLTMHILKSNCSFAELAINFQLTEKTAKSYFVETIQILSSFFVKCIHWQTRDQNQRSFPICFDLFLNTQTVLDCTEVKTPSFRCLRCRTSTYSQYKGTNTVKILIGVAPSGLINFVAPAVGGRTSDKAIFNMSTLLQKLNQGDGVMVDKGFMIGNELSSAGVEMIRPSFVYQTQSKEEVDQNTRIARARVHVERRIARVKKFKILSDKVMHSMLPYIDDIITVIFGLSNLESPILNDNKF